MIDPLFKALKSVFPKGSILNLNISAATLIGNHMADVLLEAIRYMSIEGGKRLFRCDQS